MRAVVLEAFGEPENLCAGSVPDPEAPGPGEVLLRVEACGVCYHDVINRRGNLPRTRVPAILGHEVAGEVIAVGDGVAQWSVGDRAATLQRLFCGACRYCRKGRTSLCRNDRRFFGEELPGGYAELMLAPATGIGPVPAELPASAAAVACCTAGTAVHCVRTRGRVGAGETVVITGASGGVGMQAIQLARHEGAFVVAVTSSETKVEALLAAGADHVAVAPDLRFAREVREVTGGEGADVVIEIVGAQTFAESLRALAPGGRLVVVGNLDTGIVELNPGLAIVKELEILGAYATTLGELADAFRLVAAGVLAPAIADVLPLADAALAHRRLEAREVAGRLVLAP